MGHVASGGSGSAQEERQTSLDGSPPVDSDRRLRSFLPRDLLSGAPAGRQVAYAQAYLAAGAAAMGTIATLLPHPDSFNVPGLLAVQGVAALFALLVALNADRISQGVLRLGPALATCLTTAAVYLSGDNSSGFVMLYLWVGLYAFYFPVSRGDAALNVAWAAANYAFAIAITPAPESGSISAVHHFVITAGTLLTAGVLLTYLRDRVERLMGRLTDAARTDPLTGLVNRAGVTEVIEAELERARPDRRPLSILALDLDRFKQVNERFGTAFGDKVLRRLAAVLEEAGRSMDTVARSVGEDFLIVLPDTDSARAFLYAEEFLERIRQSAAELHPGLSASIGIASHPQHGERLEELLAHSDQALYAAKALGGDRPVLFSEGVTGTIGLAAGRRSVESQAQLATVLGLAEALDQRDSSTARHSQTVGRLCELMARELGLDERRVQRVRLAGVLHDIGKIGVPDAILRKDGPLDADEMRQMRRHPELGERILSSAELDDVRTWVGAHHERPDGSGYPKGLTADEIPLEAAILAVGDAYEAMTADRVYRVAIGPERAREQLLAGAGTQFDGSVVGALLRALEREELSVS